MSKSGFSVRGAGRLLAVAGLLGWAVFVYVLDWRNRRDATSKARWLQRTCRRLLGVFAVSVASRGRPASGAVIVSNHLSYLDILVVASLAPVVFVSKKEVRSWPVFGWFAEKAGTRFIDRNKRGDVARIAEEIGPVIAERLNIVIFLEGTSSDGRDVLPFKASLLEPAVRHGWPVVPAALHYAVPSGRSAEQEVCWWGGMTLGPHLLNLTTLPWVKADVAWGEAVTAGGDRKVLAAALRGQVVALKAERAAAVANS
ncbi:MAG: 1-acyl-sn-glycerol-3-phosphate acyltransferase [Verrucomicrobia bacterium]|nr:1-acyl-sn-glycerol-3-phosphate acyltransferase [Verrucomicrobiota bacterium]